MKIKLIILLIAFIPLFSGFNYTGEQKFIGTLKDKNGKVLGNVYIEDFKKDIFRKLLIIRKNSVRKDTLYFIDNCVFKNQKGVDIQFDKKTFAGYKIEYIKKDAIQLFGVGKGTVGASDPATITWNYKKKLFEVLQSP